MEYILTIIIFIAINHFSDKIIKKIKELIQIIKIKKSKKSFNLKDFQLNDIDKKFWYFFKYSYSIFVINNNTLIFTYFIR